jgi:hypothetical protein
MNQVKDGGCPDLTGDNREIADSIGMKDIRCTVHIVCMPRVESKRSICRRWEALEGYEQ